MVLCSRITENAKNAGRVEDGKALSFFSMEENSSAVLETVKAAEDGNGYILRFYEAKGGCTKAKIRLQGFEAEGLVNLLEEPLTEQKDFVKTEDGAQISFHPFEVQSLFIRKKM